MGLSDALAPKAQFDVAVRVHELTQVPLINARFRLKWKFKHAVAVPATTASASGAHHHLAVPSSAQHALGTLHEHHSSGHRHHQAPASPNSSFVHGHSRLRPSPSPELGRAPLDWDNNNPASSSVDDEQYATATSTTTTERRSRALSPRPSSRRVDSAASARSFMTATPDDNDSAAAAGARGTDDDSTTSTTRGASRFDLSRHRTGGPGGASSSSTIGAARPSSSSSSAGPPSHTTTTSDRSPPSSPRQRIVSDKTVTPSAMPTPRQASAVHFTSPFTGASLLDNNAQSTDDSTADERPGDSRHHHHWSPTKHHQRRSQPQPGTLAQNEPRPQRARTGSSNASPDALARMLPSHSLHLPPRAEPAGSTSFVALHAHTVSFQRDIHCRVAIPVRKQPHPSIAGASAPQLVPSRLKLAIRQEDAFHHHASSSSSSTSSTHGKESRAGEVWLDLSQFADPRPRQQQRLSSATAAEDPTSSRRPSSRHSTTRPDLEGGVTRRYLLADSKTNATLKVTVAMHQVGGETRFIQPTLGAGMMPQQDRRRRAHDAHDTSNGSGANSPFAGSPFSHSPLNRSTATLQSRGAPTNGSGSSSRHLSRPPSTSKLKSSSSASSNSTQSPPASSSRPSLNRAPRSSASSRRGQQSSGRGWHPSTVSSLNESAIFGGTDEGAHDAADIVELLFNSPPPETHSHLPFDSFMFGGSAPSRAHGSAGPDSGASTPSIVTSKEQQTAKDELTSSRSSFFSGAFGTKKKKKNGGGGDAEQQQLAPALDIKAGAGGRLRGLTLTSGSRSRSTSLNTQSGNASSGVSTPLSGSRPHSIIITDEPLSESRPLSRAGSLQRRRGSQSQPQRSVSGSAAVKKKHRSGSDTSTGGGGGKASPRARSVSSSAAIRPRRSTLSLRNETGQSPRFGASLTAEPSPLESSRSHSSNGSAGLESALDLELPPAPQDPELEARKGFIGTPTAERAVSESAIETDDDEGTPPAATAATTQDNVVESQKAWG